MSVPETKIAHAVANRSVAGLTHIKDVLRTLLVEYNDRKSAVYCRLRNVFELIVEIWVFLLSHHETFLLFFDLFQVVRQLN